MRPGAIGRRLLWLAAATESAAGDIAYSGSVCPRQVNQVVSLNAAGRKCALLIEQMSSQRTR
jgi:hypothetical protein